MSKKWAHAPVYCALAQVIHNPVWQLADYAPKIQEALRQIGDVQTRPPADHIPPEVQSFLVDDIILPLPPVQKKPRTNPFKSSEGIARC